MNNDAISGAASSASDSAASSAESATASHPFLDRKHQSDQSTGRKCSSTRLLINIQSPSNGTFLSGSSASAAPTPVPQQPTPAPSVAPAALQNPLVANLLQTQLLAQMLPMQVFKLLCVW
mgnify:CR=1 FL=1